MLLWNAKYVRPPPISSVLMSGGDLNIDKLELVGSRAVSVLGNQKQLHMEAALLSRVLYRMKSKYHQNIGFKHLEKVNRGLLQYLSLDLFGVYSTFTALVPGSPRDPQVYLPTRQMLEWVLVRTQGFARLFCFIAQECQEAARHFHFLITLGHTWETALLCLGMASRIWSIAKYMVTCSCDWFSQMKPFLEVLKCTGRPWLPPGYEFPEDLIQWLDAHWLTEQLKLKSNPKTGADRVLSRLLVSAGDDEDEDMLDDSKIDIHDLISGEDTLNGSNKELLDGNRANAGENVKTCKNSEMFEMEDQNEASFIPQQWSKEDLGEKISRSSLKRMNQESVSEGLKKKREKTENVMSASLKHTKEAESKPHTKMKEVKFLINGSSKKKEDEEKAEEEKEEGVIVVADDDGCADVLVGDIEEELSVIDIIKKSSFKPAKKIILKPQDRRQYMHIPASNSSKKVLLQSDEEKPWTELLQSTSEVENGKRQAKHMRLPEVGTLSKMKLKPAKGNKSKSSVIRVDRNSETVRELEPVSRSSPKSIKQQINCLRTCGDLEVFLNRESELREKCSKKCVTRQLDKLQWNMLYNAVSVYVNKLNKKSIKKDEEQSEILMKKARKALKLRIL